MPTLDWIGKDKVINHHKDVPYKVLERKYSFDESGMHKEDIHSNNMIIHGDNLEALKSLLPQYEGKIKCIYIDPPYNTGNEGWIYNDNVNDPKIRKWLGEVVGKWRAGYCVNGLYRPNLKYDIITPNGNIIESPEKGWRWSKETLEKKIQEGEIIYNADETAIIHKLYLNDLDGKVPENIWTKGDAGTTRQATTELKILFGGKAPFDTPKPTQLLERIIQIASDDKSIILDSFAGSGTTAHAVLNMNKSDGGNRKFILVEMGDYADTITAERVKRVINGYGEEKNAVEGTGGNFSYYELGNPLFMQDGTINNEVDITEVRKYVWYTETNGIEYKEDIQEKYFLGSYNDIAYYFYYEKDRVTILDYEFLTSVHKKEQAYVMYADSCALSDSDLQKWNITFKKIPRDIEHI